VKEACGSAATGQCFGAAMRRLQSWLWSSQLLRAVGRVFVQGAAEEFVRRFLGDRAKAQPHPRDRLTLAGFKAFVYDLPAAYHNKSLSALRQLGIRQGSACDFGVSLCKENRWTPRYTTKRMYAAEVVILQKLLRAMALTTDPSQADVFIVPWLVRSHCAVREHWQRCLGSKVSGLLWNFLPHYNPDTRGRHLFLATGGPCDVPVDVQAQALVVSLGPQYMPRQQHGQSFVSGLVLVPYLNAEPQLQPGHWLEPPAASRTTWALLAFGATNWFRRALRRQFAAAAAGRRARNETGRAVVVLDFARGEYAPGHLSAARPIGRRGWNLTPGGLLDEMSTSRFCIVPPGDTPKAKRFFDAILTLCVPVVVAFPTSLGSGTSWWTYDGTPVEWSLPFAEDWVDYTRAVVAIPADAVLSGTAVKHLEAVPESTYIARMAYLRQIRTRMLFDYGGMERDAFSLVAERLASLLHLAVAAPVTCILPHRVAEASEHEANPASKRFLNEVNRRAWGERRCFFDTSVTGVDLDPAKSTTRDCSSKLRCREWYGDQELLRCRGVENDKHSSFIRPLSCIPVTTVCTLSGLCNSLARAKELVTYATCENVSRSDDVVGRSLGHLALAEGPWTITMYNVCGHSATMPDMSIAAYTLLVHLLHNYATRGGLVQIALPGGMGLAVEKHAVDVVDANGVRRQRKVLDLLEDRGADGVSWFGSGGLALVLDSARSRSGMLGAGAMCNLYHAIFSARCPTQERFGRDASPASVVTTWEAVRRVPQHRWESALFLSYGRARSPSDVVGLIGALLHEAGMYDVAGADTELHLGRLGDMDFEDLDVHLR